LDNKVFDVTDARCKHEVHLLSFRQLNVTVVCFTHLVNSRGLSDCT